MNTLLLVKIIVLVLNPIETGLGALIPVCLKRMKNAARAMSVAAAAAAGIFLGVGVCHMLDDATEFLEAVLAKLHGFPLALFLCCCGFSLLLLLEKLVFTGEHHHHHHAPSHTAEETEPLTVNATPEHAHSHEHMHAHALVKGALMTVGIMIHSAVSGLATGVARDMTTLTMLAVACFAHDWSHASALVILYDELKLGRKAVVGFLAMFVATEPVCIAIGIGVTSVLTDATALIVSGVLSAVAAGVFIYIAVCELIREAFEEPHDHVLKFVVFFLFMSGIAAVAAIA